MSGAFGTPTTTLCTAVLQPDGGFLLRLLQSTGGLSPVAVQLHDIVLVHGAMSRAGTRSKTEALGQRDQDQIELLRVAAGANLSS